MRQYYQDTITDESFVLLSKLNQQIDLLLIGGWAVWLYTKSLKSKDVDFIIDYSVLSFLQSKFPVFKNERLKKYELIEGRVSVDIYLPHFSFIGIKIEELSKYKTRKSGFTILTKEALLLTKQTAYKSRFASAKGQKDKVDILSLILLPDFDFQAYQELLKTYGLTEYLVYLKKILNETHEFKELGLNAHAFAILKKRLMEII